MTGGGFPGTFKKKLKHDIARDLDMHRDVLKQIISSDIVAAYYFQAGAVENSLRSDKQVGEAVKLLKDRARYDSILNGTYRQDTAEQGDDDETGDTADEDL